MSEKPSPTYNQINQQWEAGHRQPSVLVPRNTGEIQAGHVTGRNEQGKWEVSFDKVNTETGETEQGLKMARPEALSDQVQEKLATALAESVDRGPEAWNRTAPELGSDALKQAGIEAPTEEIEPDDRYAHLFGSAEPDLSVEAAAVRTESNPMDTARAAADAKYNEVMKATGNDEAATAASGRVYDEMMRQR